MEPADQIRLAKENLVLAVSFATAADQGVIGARFVPRNPDDESTRRRFDSSAPLQIHDPGDLRRCVNNQVRCAFAFSALQTNRALEFLYGDNPINDPDSDLQAARCIIYLISETVAADLMAPVWICPPEYRRPFTVEPADFLLDAAALDGQPVGWEDFGGMDKYLALLDFCANPTLTFQPTPLLQEPSSGGETPSPYEGEGWGGGGLPALNRHRLPLLTNPPRQAGHPQPLASEPTTVVPTSTDKKTPSPYQGESRGEGQHPNSVDAFVQTQCRVNPEEMTIAKDLYAAYQQHCRQNAQKPLSQRSFGMGLTALGFERRRRGKGKHWWLGLSPNSVPATA